MQSYGKYSKEYVMENKKQFIFSDVLNYIQFTEDELKELIGSVSLYVILKTQKLSLSFIKEYVMNSELYEYDNETNINLEAIMFYQPYSKEQLL